MKRLLIILILLLMFVGRAEATRYWCVCTDAPNDAGTAMESDPGEDSSAWTKENCYQHMVTLKNAADDDANGPHIVRIANGTYSTTSDAFYLNDDRDLDGMQIIGESRDGVVFTSPYTTDFVRGQGANNITMQNMTFAPALTGNYNIIDKESTSTGWVLENMIFQSAGSQNTHIIEHNGGTLDIKRCKFLPATAPMTMDGDASGTMSFCTIEPLPNTPWMTLYLNSATTGTYNIYNTAFLGADEWCIYHSGTGTLNINNCILWGSLNDAGDYILNNSVNGTLNADYNLMFASVWDSDNYFMNNVTDGGHNKTGTLEPKWLSHPRHGYIIPRVDDASVVALGYIEDVLDVLDDYGYSLTWAINCGALAGGGLGYDITDIRSLITSRTNGDFELSSHSWSHTRLSYDYAINLSCSSCAEDDTVAVTIDGSNSSIVMDDADGSTYDCTVDIDSLDNVDAIITWINANCSGWTAAKSTTQCAACSTAQSADDIGGLYLSYTTLDAMNATAIGADKAIDVAFDKGGYDTGFYKWELADSKSYLTTQVNAAGNVTDPQTGATYECVSFFAPTGNYESDARTALIDSGYIFANGAPMGVGALDGCTTPDCDAYYVDSYLYSWIKNDGTEADIRIGARTIAMYVLYGGYVFSPYCHSTDDLTVEQWGWICDEWKKMGVGPDMVVTPRQFIATLQAGWTDDEDGTYSRTYTNSDLIDFRLQASSPLINAGTSPFSDGDGDQYDYAGNLVWSDTTDAAVGAWSDGVEIGAYGWFGGILLH